MSEHSDGSPAWELHDQPEAIVITAEPVSGEAPNPNPIPVRQSK